METNPWLQDPQGQVDSNAPTIQPATAHNPPCIDLETRGGLPIGEITTPGQIAVVAAHGGAGATTWAHLLQAHDCGAQWPAPGWTTTTAIVVARASRAGLEAARLAGLQWAAGNVTGTALIGLILAPDLPGKLPKPLRDTARNVRGIYPQVFDMPLESAWRLCLPDETPPTKAAASIITKITGRTQ